MTKLGDMFHIPVADRLNKRRPCVQKTIGRSGTLFCHCLLILVAFDSGHELHRILIVIMIMTHDGCCAGRWPVLLAGAAAGMAGPTTTW